MHVTAIIAAGGRGERLGGRALKQLLPIAGRAMLDRSVSAFLTHPAIAEVIVALPQAVIDDPPTYLSGGKSLRLVAGGARRQDSVANAFRAAARETEVFVIHDAARPFVTAELITRTIAAAAESGAAVAAIPARDTVKQGELMVRPERAHPSTSSGRASRTGHHERNPNPLILSSSKDEHWMVKATLARETIFLAQTPQAFRREVLAAAFDFAARTNAQGTDEAALAEGAGHRVRLVEGDASNIKITTPEDLAVADAILLRSQEAAASYGGQVARELPRTGRAGTGYDLHRLAPGRPLVVGGVTIASDRGAVGHSDADVACHAITDAILGAAGLGDIGRHFPDSDPQWKGASSLDLLGRAVAIVADSGYEVGNVDVTVVLETPKIRDYVRAMREAIAGAIGLDVAQVSVKGKTNEGVDAVGRGDAIAAHAVALIRTR